VLSLIAARGVGRHVFSGQSSSSARRRPRGECPVLVIILVGAARTARAAYGQRPGMAIWFVVGRRSARCASVLHTVNGIWRI
jgi:hypothetical protein